MTISRRLFLSIVAAASGGVAMCGLAIRHWSGRRCESCGAVVRRMHVIWRGQWRGTYCPNCGVDTARGMWRVGTDATLERTRGVIQVPFPNRALLIETKKPTAVLKDIRL